MPFLRWIPLVGRRPSARRNRKATFQEAVERELKWLVFFFTHNPIVIFVSIAFFYSMNLFAWLPDSVSCSRVKTRAKRRGARLLTRDLSALTMRGAKR